METWRGKHFTISVYTDIHVIGLEIYVTKREYLYKYPKYTMEVLNTTEKIEGDKKHITFYVDDPDDNGNRLNFIYISKGAVITQDAILIGDKVRILKTRIGTSQNNNAIRTFSHTVNQQKRNNVLTVEHRPDQIIIDPESGKVIEPEACSDDKTGQIKQVYLLQPDKKFIVFSISEKEFSGMEMNDYDV